VTEEDEGRAGRRITTIMGCQGRVPLHRQRHDRIAASSVPVIEDKAAEVGYRDHISTAQVNRVCQRRVPRSYETAI
jgi:hypothetical protein